MIGQFVVYDAVGQLRNRSNRLKKERLLINNIYNNISIENIENCKQAKQDFNKYKYWRQYWRKSYQLSYRVEQKSAILNSHSEVRSGWEKPSFFDYNRKNLLLTHSVIYLQCKYLKNLIQQKFNFHKVCSIQKKTSEAL